MDQSSHVQPLTQANDHVLYGDLHAHPTESSTILALKELHDGSSKNPQTSIVLINGSEMQTLLCGQDFYSHPRFSPCGRHISWLSWDLPHMQWTGAILHVADFRSNQIEDTKSFQEFAGAGQPRWGSRSGALYFAHGRTGYQQLYVTDLTHEPTRVHVEGLEDCEFAGAEFWLAR